MAPVRIAAAAALAGAWLLAWQAAAQPVDLPAAIYQDPAVDAAHPASGGGVQFVSHGAAVNAQLYRPAGAGQHPTVILLHGLPGNEQNLDLARAMQRAGWTVITFHYRGSWGSGGQFTLKGGIEDAKALLAQLHTAQGARAWGVDDRRIVVIGHSYGGLVAAATAAGAPDLLGVGLIAPWDVSHDQRALSKLAPADLAKAASAGFNDVEGRLGEVTIASLTDDLLTNGADLSLARLGPAFADRPVLVVTATRDDPGDKAIDLLPALRKAGPADLTTREMDTDHGFNDHRIALEKAVLDWLEGFRRTP
jgi:acetyl esterase/lipase